MRVENMISQRGKPVPNQFIVVTPNATYFQSYKSIIVKTAIENGERAVYLDKTYYDYSRTTSKYRNQFLGETTKEIEAKIKQGIYKLVDLNSEVIA